MSESYVLICGSRSLKSAEFVNSILDSLVDKTMTVVHGACPTGADQFADEWCSANGVEVKRFPAEWSKGKKAGPLRNEEMVSLKPTLAIAFYDGDGKNIGTTDTTKRLLRSGYRTVKSIWRGKDFVLVMRPS